MNKKILTVIGISILFLGVGIQPAIAEKQTQEYTLMTPSIFGLKNQQISLTSEQSDKLECIFDDLHEQLNSVSSIEETKLLYKKTIDTLVDNDLLSKSNAFLTEKLLFSNIVDKFYSFLNKKFDKNLNLKNWNCWITGNVSNSDFFRPFLWRKLEGHIFIFGMLLNVYFLRNKYFGDISFGYHYEEDHNRKDTWSNGFISTNGRFGLEEFIGKFRGRLSTIRVDTFAGFYTYFLGVYYFIGISYLNEFGEDYFIGRAYAVDIYEKPDV